MELVAIEKSSLLKLALTGRPQGQLHAPSIVAAIQERFHFEIAPKTLADVISSMEFEHGFDGNIAIEKLGIYADGVVLQARSPTDNLDAFLKTLVGWATETLGVSVHKTQAIDTLYESNIIVRAKADLIASHRKMNIVGKKLQQNLKEASGINAAFEPVELSISPDLTKLLGLKPVAFQVSRRTGIGFEENVFFSVAPLPTQMHLDILEALESISAT